MMMPKTSFFPCNMMMPKTKRLVGNFVLQGRWILPIKYKAQKINVLKLIVAILLEC